MQPAPQDNQLMSKHRVLSFKPHLRLEWRGQDGQNETEQPDHSASLGDSITSSTRIRFSVHTTGHLHRIGRGRAASGLPPARPCKNQELCSAEYLGVRRICISTRSFVPRQYFGTAD